MDCSYLEEEQKELVRCNALTKQLGDGKRIGWRVTALGTMSAVTTRPCPKYSTLQILPHILLPQLRDVLHSPSYFSEGLVFKQMIRDENTMEEVVCTFVCQDYRT